MEIEDIPERSGIGQTSLIFPETSQRNIVRADMNNEEHGKMSRSMFRDLGEADKES